MLAAPACAPVRFWAVAAAPTPDDPATDVFIDSLCPDVLEALVHTLLLLQVRAGWPCQQAVSPRLPCSVVGRARQLVHHASLMFPSDWQHTRGLLLPS